MLSIASWRSGRASEPEPETVAPVVPRAASIPKGPAPVAAPPRAPEPAPAPPVQKEHRGAPRVPASAVPSIKGLTLSPFGAEAMLVNISASGLLAESRTPLKIGNLVKVIFEGTFAPKPADGRVVRICVASMAPSGVRYNIGLVFNAPLNLEDQVAPQSHADKKPATGAIGSGPPEPSPLVNRW